MPVVGIDDAQARFGCGGQVNGVSAPQKDGRRQPLVDISNSCHNFLILSEPLESSHLDMSPYLGQQGGISRCSDRSFAQLAMEGRYHFGLPVRRADNMVCRRELSNGVCARVSIVKPDQVTGIEVDHNPSCSRSSLIVFVESVPPRKYFRWARNARVNVGWAKNGLAGMGETGMILATKRPRSVT